MLWTEGCVNCKAFEPIFDSLAAEFPDVEFKKVNFKDVLDDVKRFEVVSLPTILFTKDGEFLDKLAGLKPRTLVVKKLAEVF